MKNKYKVLTVGDNLGGIALAFQKAGFDIIGSIVFKPDYERAMSANLESPVYYHSTSGISIKEFFGFTVLAGQLELVSESAATYRGKKEESILSDDDDLYCDHKTVFDYIFTYAPLCFFLETRMAALKSAQLTELLSSTQNMGYNVSYKLLETHEITGKPIKSKRLYIVGIKAQWDAPFYFPEANKKSMTFQGFIEPIAEERAYIKSSKYEIQCTEPGVYVWKGNRYQLSQYINYSIYPTKIRDEFGLRNISNRELSLMKGFPDTYRMGAMDAKGMYQAIWRSPDIDVCSIIAGQIKALVDRKQTCDNDESKNSAARDSAKDALEKSEKTVKEDKNNTLYSETEKNVERRFDVFVSSTYEDLIEERKEVTQAVLECDCIPVGMEMFPASNLEQWNFIKKVIEKSDFYLVIAAGKYGSIGVNESGERMSYTEMEFDYAKSIGKPILAFLIKDMAELKSGKVDIDEEKRMARDRFQEKVKNGRMVQFYSNKDELKAKVLLSISKLKKQFNTGGWIRESEAGDGQTDALRQALNNLEAENVLLRKQLKEAESNIKLEQTEKENNMRNLIMLQDAIDEFEEKIEGLREKS